MTTLLEQLREMVTAAEAFERYTQALNENRLIQSAWHKPPC